LHRAAHDLSDDRHLLLVLTIIGQFHQDLVVDESHHSKSNLQATVKECHDVIETERRAARG